MGLLTKKVIVKWNEKNRKWYEEKGYIFTKTSGEFEVKVEDLTKGSNVKISVKCDCKDCKNPYLKPMMWKIYNKHKHEDGNYYCQKCAVNLFSKENSKNTRLKRTKSFEEWCIENNRQDVLDRWDYELNNCLPNEISYGTKQKHWFKCPKGLHKSELKSILDFTRGHNGTINCKQCNSIGQYIIDNYGQEFLDKTWSNKNNKSPFEYPKNGSVKLWWKCLNNKHKEYQREINTSNKRCFRCSCCVEERDESFLQEKVRKYLEETNYTILHEYNCTIVPINPKTKQYLPFDNEIKELKLICEVNGKQHYEISGFHRTQAKKHNITLEQEFHYQKLKDRYKSIKAIQEEYYYLEIPYWTDDKEETWKKLIDNKLNEINFKRSDENNGSMFNNISTNCRIG